MSKKFDEAVYEFCKAIAADFENEHDHLNCDGLFVWCGRMESEFAKSKAFVPPTPEIVEAKGAELGYANVDGKVFCDHYELCDWCYGKAKTKMKKWPIALGRACKDGWCLKDSKKPSGFDYAGLQK